MATFPSIKPTYGQQKRSAPNIRTVRFADGFIDCKLLNTAEFTDIMMLVQILL